MIKYGTKFELYSVRSNKLKNLADKFDNWASESIQFFSSGNLGLWVAPQ